MLVLLLAAAAHLWGIRKDLPWAFESDEAKFTLIAAQMAKDGDPDPGWFGHPGSTVLYPQALAIQLDDAARTGRSWLDFDPGLGERFAQDPAPALLLGRFISVSYAILSLALVFALGNRAFGPPVGLVGAWLALLSPLALDHAQMVRTDSAGVFFGCLGLWLSLRLLDRPAVGPHLLAGVAIGLGIGTRYFLVALVGVLLVVDAILFFRAGSGAARRRIAIAAAAALCAVVVGFVVSTPYFLLDLPTVWKNLAHEAREFHLGQENLGFLGNLGFYLGDVARRQLGGAERVLVVIGVGWAIARRRAEPLLLLGFVAVYLVGISLSALHWERWWIQVRPLIVLFAAAAIVWGVDAAGLRLRWSRRGRAVALVIAVLLVSGGPALRFAEASLAQARPSTRITAREWILANLPASARLAAEIYTAPLDRTRVRVDYRFALGEGVSSPDTYRQAGYDHLLVSSALYNRYLRAPQRHPAESRFYRTLFREGELVAEFRAPPGGRGPTIRLYRLPRPRRP